VADSDTYSSNAIPSTSATYENLLLRPYLARSTGLVTELAFSPNTKDPLGTVGEIVQNLRNSNQFTVVDILPGNAAKVLSDPAVFAPKGSDTALTLDFTTFNYPVPPSQTTRGTQPSRSKELPKATPPAEANP